MANAWKAIGTVVGNTSTGEYTFILKSYQSRVGDLVAVRMDVPAEDYGGTTPILVWGRIVAINRFNPFFPYEAAQELASEGLSLMETILSSSRDQLEASVTILGSSTEGAVNKIFPLTYPVQPAAEVLYPPANVIKKLLGRRDTGAYPTANRCAYRQERR